MESDMKLPIIKSAALAACFLGLAACQSGPFAGIGERNREAELRDQFESRGVSVSREGQGYRLDIPQDVFFSFDSATLHPEAREIIRVIATDAQNIDAEIQVNGYTDTAGDRSYNEMLSQARADAVAGELERSGIDPRRIAARGLGESNLRIATPDGVREPQNRRVEIILEPVTG